VGTGLTRYLGQSHEIIGWNSRQDVRSLTTETLRELKIDAVVNCAAITDRVTPIFSVQSPSDLVNVGGARALFLALQGTGIPLIHISTKDVFGKLYTKEDILEEEYAYRPAFQVDDNQPFRPETIYSKSKLMAEFIVEGHPEHVVIRLSSCYTDLDHSNGSWVVKIAKRIQDQQEVHVSHNGKQFRDLLHVDDLGSLILKVLQSKTYGFKLNAGGGPSNTHSVLDVIRMYDSSAQVVEGVDDGDYGFAFNNRRAKEVYQWQPEIRFTDRVPTILNNIQTGART
jgi:nucleoside-diphosphate-sugar epimerase